MSPDREEQKVPPEAIAAKNALVPRILHHDLIIKIMQALGYPSDAAGVCFGIAAMAAQAALLGRDALMRFDARLKYIHDHSETLQQIGNLWQEQKRLWEMKPRQLLSPKEEKLLKKLLKPLSQEITDILAFFDDVELYHQAQSHPELFGGCDVHIVSQWPTPPDSPSPKVPIEFPCYVYVKGSTAHAGSEEKALDYVEQPAQLLYIQAGKEPEKIVLDAQTQRFIQEAGDVPYIRLNTQQAKQFGNFTHGTTVPTSQDLDAAQLLCPVTMENPGPAAADEKKEEKNNNHLMTAAQFSGAYSLKELETYFGNLAQHAGEQPVVLILGSTNHAITVAYDPKANGKKWSFTDARQLPTQYTDSKSKLAQKVFSDLFGREAVIFNTWVVTSGDRQTDLDKKVTGWKNSLEEILTVTQEKIKLLNQFNVSWLHVAAKDGDLAAVQALLDKGAVFEQADKDGVAPLHFAAASGHPAVVQALLDKGADANQAVKKGATPLHFAASKGKAPVVKALLEGGAIDKRTFWTIDKSTSWRSYGEKLCTAGEMRGRKQAVYSLKVKIIFSTKSN